MYLYIDKICVDYW